MKIKSLSESPNTTSESSTSNAETYYGHQLTRHVHMLCPLEELQTVLERHFRRVAPCGGRWLGAGAADGAALQLVHLGLRLGQLVAHGGKRALERVAFCTHRIHSSTQSRQLL